MDVARSSSLNPQPPSICPICSHPLSSPHQPKANLSMEKDAPRVHVQRTFRDRHPNDSTGHKCLGTSRRNTLVTVLTILDKPYSQLVRAQREWRRIPATTSTLGKGANQERAADLQCLMAGPSQTAARARAAQEQLHPEV